MPLDPSKTYLDIFVRNFIVDENLPKFTVAKENLLENIKPKNNGGILEFVDPDAIQSNYLVGKERPAGVTITSELLDGTKTPLDLLVVANIFKGIQIDDAGLQLALSVSEPEEVNKLSFWDRFKKKKEPNKNLLLDPIDFFRYVKLTSEASEHAYIERSKPFLLAIKRAKEMGQQALIDKLLGELLVNKYESILRAEGFGKVITEEQLVQFIKKTKNGIKLSYVKNFTRNIPPEVIELKKKVDQLYIFDNYCILYYDPEGTVYSETAEEKEKERQRKADPILFGLIKGCKKLYYITDWIDDWCDLTLEQFLKVSGLTEKEIEIPFEIKL
jgi:hypothetical protein